MKHYRNQPQATSHVYRSVLLRKTGAPAAKDEKTSDTVNKFICFTHNNDYSLVRNVYDSNKYLQMIETN